MADTRRIVVGVTGGIAAYKVCDLVRRLVEAGDDVHVVMTEAATRFVAPLTFQALSGNEVGLDLFDLGRESRMNHIGLAREADLVVVAPATADFLARAAGGHADDLLATLLLATRAPVLLAPSMNTAMWEHCATQANVERLGGFTRYRIVPPDSGDLACGEVGAGRLPDVGILVEAVQSALTTQDLAGRRVLVTAGATREAVDAVRFLSNRATGRMGFALAKTAARRGARVAVVHGPTDLSPPHGVEAVPIESAAELKDAVLGRAERSDVVVKAAAVADVRPTRREQGKTRKTDLPRALELERTDDVLALLGARGTDRPLLVGFAAETRDLDVAGPEKLAAKGCALLVANRIDEPGAGFGTATNRAVIYDRAGGREPVPASGDAPVSKEALADRIWDRVVALLSEAS